MLKSSVLRRNSLFECFDQLHTERCNRIESSTEIVQIFGLMIFTFYEYTGSEVALVGHGVLTVALLVAVEPVVVPPDTVILSLSLANMV